MRPVIDLSRYLRSAAPDSRTHQAHQENRQNLSNKKSKPRKFLGGAIIECPEEARRFHSHYLLKKHSDKTIVQVRI